MAQDEPIKLADVTAWAPLPLIVAICVLLVGSLAGAHIQGLWKRDLHNIIHDGSGNDYLPIDYPEEYFIKRWELDIDRAQIPISAAAASTSALSLMEFNSGFFYVAVAIFIFTPYVTHLILSAVEPLDYNKKNWKITPLCRALLLIYAALAVAAFALT
ncbi:hypothetical protein [Rhodococcus opacus]|uniref:hypothetical protein n=2 Tax=Rhodococcus TaxID=1827 RepID=UPI00138AEDAC|nr:hypothetical protein [Rhodococcus opacus]